MDPVNVSAKFEEARSLLALHVPEIIAIEVLGGLSKMFIGLLFAWTL